jgi:hypothetical protein
VPLLKIWLPDLAAERFMQTAAMAKWLAKALGMGSDLKAVGNNTTFLL